MSIHEYSTTFAYGPGTKVTVIAHQLNAPGSIVSARVARKNLHTYDVQYCVNGSILRGDFYEEELMA